jgi:hypothetical protein
VSQGFGALRAGALYRATEFYFHRAGSVPYVGWPELRDGFWCQTFTAHASGGGMPMLRRAIAAFLAALVCGCTTTDNKPPLVTTPKGEAAGAPVARTPLETPAIPPQAIAPKVASAPPLQVTVPPNTQYVCVIQRGSEQQQTAIEFAPKVAKLCAKHPEMGPCQYERNNCRASGGRVFAANGQEITMLTEAEYDKKVMRVRFKAN